MKKLSLVSLSATALIALVATAGPASASVGGTCLTGHRIACLYENNDFNNGNTDDWRDLGGSVSNFNTLTWFNHASVATNDKMDNETSSIRNRVGCTVTLWQNVGYTGAYTDFGNNVDDGYLANNSIGDNRASAIVFHC